MKKVLFLAFLFCIFINALHAQTWQIQHLSLGYRVTDWQSSLDLNTLHTFMKDEEAQLARREAFLANAPNANVQHGGGGFSGLTHHYLNIEFGRSGENLSRFWQRTSFQTGLYGTGTQIRQVDFSQRENSEAAVNHYFKQRLQIFGVNLGINHRVPLFGSLFFTAGLHSDFGVALRHSFTQKKIYANGQIEELPEIAGKNYVQAYPNIPFGLEIQQKRLSLAAQIHYGFLLDRYRLSSYQRETYGAQVWLRYRLRP